MTFVNILWYLLIYAFLGWCTEVIFAATKTGEFVNRGFLNGPYCPIYGVGVTLVVFLLEPVKGNLFYLFIGSVLITSAIELIVGFVLEKIFHQKWWDYSEKPFNLGGYICLRFSLIWGLACLVMVDKIHPLIYVLVNKIPQLASAVILTFFACLVSVDLIDTVKAILKLNKKLEILDDITLKIRETSDTIGESLATGTINFVQKKDDLEEKLENKKEIIKEDIKEELETVTFAQKRLLKAFPGLRSIDHKEALEKLRKAIHN